VHSTDLVFLHTTTTANKCCRLSTLTTSSKNLLIGPVQTDAAKVNGIETLFDK
jgi:hypothetical protein